VVVDLGVPGDQPAAVVLAGVLERAQVGDLDREAEPVAAVGATGQRPPLVDVRGLVRRCHQVGERRDRPVRCERDSGELGAALLGDGRLVHPVRLEVDGLVLVLVVAHRRLGDQRRGQLEVAEQQVVVGERPAPGTELVAGGAF
jgi:hypothetical protein